MRGGVSEVLVSSVGMLLYEGVNANCRCIWLPAE